MMLLPNIPFIMKREVQDIVTGVENENNFVKEFFYGTELSKPV